MIKIKKELKDTRLYTDFIVECNENGLHIEDGDEFIFGLENYITLKNKELYDLRQDEEWQIQQKEFEKEKRRQKLQEEIDKIDKKRIRAICEPSMKTETESWLDFYNSQISDLREEISSL